MFLADLHVHSQYSDGKLTIPELVDLYGTLGFGALAITDHLCEQKTLIGKAARIIGHTLTPESFPKYLSLIKAEAERAWDQFKLVLIPGFELSKNSVSNHRSAHILGLGVSEFQWADPDVVDLARGLRKQGALAIAAHPVSTRKIEKQTYHLWDRRAELENEFDAWEVASGPYLFDEIGNSKLPKIATSDLHSPKQMTAWKTVFHCERRQDAILEAIKKQCVDFHFFNAPQALPLTQ